MYITLWWCGHHQALSLEVWQKRSSLSPPRIRCTACCVFNAFYVRSCYLDCGSRLLPTKTLLYDSWALTCQLQAHIHSARKIRQWQCGTAIWQTMVIFCTKDLTQAKNHGKRHFIHTNLIVSKYEWGHNGDCIDETLLACLWRHSITHMYGGDPAILSFGWYTLPSFQGHTSINRYRWKADDCRADDCTWLQGCRAHWSTSW